MMNTNTNNGSHEVKTTVADSNTTNHHRGSDASDASNSHLMVYDELQERKRSISFDKIRQISLTYSLQSEDIGDFELDTNGANGGGGEGDEQRPPLENGYSEAVLRGDQLQVIANELVNSHCASSASNESAKTVPSRSEGGSGREVAAQVICTGLERDIVRPRAVGPNAVEQSALIGHENQNRFSPKDAGGRLTTAAAARVERQSFGAAQKNPFIIYAEGGRIERGDNRDQDEEYAAAADYELGSMRPELAIGSQTLRPSRSPARSSHEQRQQPPPPPVSNNNNSTNISLKLAKNMSANIIIDSDNNNNNRIALIEDRLKRPARHQLLAGDDQFSSDNSQSSCWECDSQRLTAGIRPTAINSNLTRAPFETDNRRRLAELLGQRNANTLNNGLNQLARGQYHEQAPEEEEDAPDRGSRQTLTSDQRRRRSLLNTRDPNAGDALAGEGPLQSRHLKQKTTAPIAGGRTISTNGQIELDDGRPLASDNSGPFFEAATTTAAAALESEPACNFKNAVGRQPDGRRQDEGVDLGQPPSEAHRNYQQQERVEGQQKRQQLTRTRSATPQPSAGHYQQQHPLPGNAASRHSSATTTTTSYAGATDQQQWGPRVGPAQLYSRQQQWSARSFDQQVAPAHYGNQYGGGQSLSPLNHYQQPQCARSHTISNRASPNTGSDGPLNGLVPIVVSSRGRSLARAQLSDRRRRHSSQRFDYHPAREQRQRLDDEVDWTLPPRRRQVRGQQYGGGGVWSLQSSPMRRGGPTTMTTVVSSAHDQYTPTRRLFPPAECGSCRRPVVDSADEDEERQLGAVVVRHYGHELQRQDHDDELEETKQISIIIGTPKRRRAGQRQENSGSSTASTSTPPPPLARRGSRASDFYYYDDDDQQAAVDAADGGPVGRARPRWRRPGDGAQTGQQQARWPLDAGDNSELVSASCRAAPEANISLGHQHHQQASPSTLQKQRGGGLLSRRSTISSSSEGGDGGLGAGAGFDFSDGLPPASNGRRFQRRPTGPFEVVRPAGDGQQQQQSAVASKVAQQSHPTTIDDHHRESKAALAAADTARVQAPSAQQINLDASRPADRVATSGSKPDAAVAPPAPSEATKTPPVQVQKPIKLRNLLTDEIWVDTFHSKSKLKDNSKGCSETRCLGALINPAPVEHRVRSADEIRHQAREFIDGYYSSIKRFDTPAHKNRLREIEEQIDSTETYYLRETELIYGAKLAWRNAPRCIGRIQWSKLQVFDARITRNADEMFEAICNHIKYATNKGSLRSAITIFPQRVKSTQNDWRVWNPQLIGYAGYKDKETGKVTGDPINVQITEICQKLGWQGKGGPFDVLPIVLQANGGPPQLFKLPEELVLRVKISHPNLDWFHELQLEWYALPAVSSMMLDVGGLQFTACPFNGWYMVTEVGTRDLADAGRYNMLEPIAQRMNLNTTTNMSLWRDQALTQLNLAVLHSYQQAGVTIVDHHTACETFMTHLKNEQRLRGGCPADWVWLVPPTAGSTTQVFHQEMVNYHVLPNYEYLQPAWKNFDWLKWERMRTELKSKPSLLINSAAAACGSGGAGGVEATGGGGGGLVGSPGSKLALIKASTSSLSPLSRQRIGINKLTSASGSLSPVGSPASQTELTPRHLRFKEIARAVKFTSKLFGKALSRRIKATILYATETGKSERFANKLAQTFSHAFNVHLMSMSDYDMTCLEHEALLLIVTSTFGNGDPPENGELFAKHLAAIKMTGDSSPDIDSINSVSTNPFFQMLSEDHKDGLSQASGGAGGPSSLGVVSQSAGGGGGSLGDSSQSSSSGDGSLSGCQLDELDDSDDSASVGSSGSLNSALGQVAAGATSGAKSIDTERTLPATPKDLSKTSRRRATLSVHRQQQQQQQDSICHLNQEQQTQIRPLSNVRFAVFALGSTAYPHFCAFGRYVDQTLGDLGAERILKCHCGDELCGQEKAFTEWSNQVFRVACDVFCITDAMELMDMDRPETIWTPNDVRFEYVDEDLPPGSMSQTSSSSKSSIIQNLAGIVGKKILPFGVKRRLNLHESVPDEGLQTICVDLDGGLKPVTFQPGDHIGIYPVNKFEVVDKILKRIEQDLKLSDSSAGEGTVAHNMDKKVSILVKRGNMDPLTQGDEWVQFDTLPITSIREALTRYLDITNPPNQDFLSILARQTNDSEDKKRLQQMARNFTVYESWKNKQFPSLLSTLEEFKTVRFDPALITQIPPMKPRFYSVSGVSISLTLGVVRYKTASGEPREGLCSNYLNTVSVDPKSYVFGYVRSAPAFHMPQDKGIPMLLISAGTGIAPFRAFWQRRHLDIELARQQESGKQQVFGRMEFYFGCRNSRYILYKDELEDMHSKGVLSSINIAFSRPLDRDVIEQAPAKSQEATNPVSKIDSIRQARKRVYVQDKLLENHKFVFKSIVQDGAHIYVCGDVAMASGVYKTLAKVININLKANNKLARQPTSGQDPKSANIIAANKSEKADLVKSGDDGDSVLMNLRNLNRYHEDIFGAKTV